MPHAKRLTLDTQDIVKFKRDWTKRTFDLLLATTGTLAFVPNFFSSEPSSQNCNRRGLLFTKQHGVGRGGTLFEMYKFRTMVANADSIGGSLTTYKDTRVTRIGRFLRWTKLDELPNLINVIKGEMSLIGPRPEAPVYVKHYTETQRQVLQVKPGMTGPSATREP